MHLSAKLSASYDAEPFIARIAESDNSSDRAKEARLIRGDRTLLPNGFRCVLRLGVARDSEIGIPPTLAYLRDGDIVRINPRASEIRVLYRRHSKHNVLFFTERCNSRCLMCSQPPREIDDAYLIEEILEAIPLMAADTSDLCITGGEPTLLGQRFLDVLTSAKQWLPKTSLHLLSNGRLFSDLKLVRDVASVGHPDFMIGIPLYSDVASRHDFVVQAKGAFDETVRGIMNLARCEQKIEVRFVIHRQTFERLPQTARFISRNLPFIDQVAFMGLEMMGFTKTNLEGLWIDPVDYQPQLRQAVRELTTSHINVMIYNHQLCVLEKELWPFARRSISDWKNIYMPNCEPCMLRSECGGFFSSALLRYSRGIKPFHQPVGAGWYHN